MSLADAGVLFALVDQRQKEHARCRHALRLLPKPIHTTWPCFTEAMYFARRAGGLAMQTALWHYIETNVFTFHDLSQLDVMRMSELMVKYFDTSMDLADASLVAAAEALGEKRIFTLDSDFYVYRLNNTETFEVVP